MEDNPESVQIFLVERLLQNATQIPDKFKVFLYLR